MTLQYVRDYYGVPAKRGGRVRFEGQHEATILSATHHLHVRFDDGCEGWLHPTWEVEYLPVAAGSSGEPQTTKETPNE